MGRPEQPIDPTEGPVARFAWDLRQLRHKSGNPPYRKMALIAHYSSTTLSMAAAGHRLPSLDVTRGYVRACGGDVGAWERRWHALTEHLSPPTRPSTSGETPAGEAGEEDGAARTAVAVAVREAPPRAAEHRRHVLAARPRRRLPGALPAALTAVATVVTAGGAGYAWEATHVPARRPAATPGTTVSLAPADLARYQPTHLTATAAPGRLALSWNLPAAADRDGERIVVRQQPADRTVALQPAAGRLPRSYVLSPLTHGTRYCAQVEVVLPRPDGTTAAAGSQPVCATVR